MAKEFRVVGLYSFPKSGNTWLRAIMAAAIGVPEGPGMMQKYMTDTHYGKVMENPWEFMGVDWYFYKSHHKEVMTEHMGETFHTDKVLHIYRHPLDVFVSYLNFVSKNVSPELGRKLLDIEFESVDELSEAQMERLFSLWLTHVTLFPQNKVFGSLFEATKLFRKAQAAGEPVHIVRYEDLKEDFRGTCQGMFDFLGFEGVDTEAVFKDADARTAQNGKFFWKRSAKNYEKYLSEDQIRRFNMVYAREMAELGYED